MSDLTDTDTQMDPTGNTVEKVWISVTLQKPQTDIRTVKKRVIVGTKDLVDNKQSLKCIYKLQ